MKYENGIYLLNGDNVPVSDRSFQYGDGCFTTMQIHQGRVMHWSLHVARMQASLALLGIAEPDWNELLIKLTERLSPIGLGGAKLLISRGSGGRGYASQDAVQPRIWLSIFDYPEHYIDQQKQGVALGVSSIKLGHNPLLAGHKHNNRLEQILARRALEGSDFSDAIMLDIDDHVIETTCANIFWRKGTTLYTPALDNAGVAGIMRRWIMQVISNMPYEIVVGEFALSELNHAEEVWVTNALLGVAPVVTILDQTYAIGALTRQLQKRILAC